MCVYGVAAMTNPHETWRSFKESQDVKSCPDDDRVREQQKGHPASERIFQLYTRQENAPASVCLVTVHLVEVHERVPEGVLGQDARVSNDNAPEASTCESNVEAARVRQETDALVLV